MLAEYYYQILYPLQDKAIEVFRGSPFYLTGGTVLSRVYYKHRFSDDLDYFVNYLSDFEKIAEIQVKNLSEIFKDVEVEYRGEYFYRIFVSQRRLKIELVNDVPAHIGELTEDPHFGLIDSKENILDVHSKAAGIPPLYVAKVLGEFDYSLLDTEIKWITPVPSDEIKRFLTGISESIVRGIL